MTLKEKWVVWDTEKMKKEILLTDCYYEITCSTNKWSSPELREYFGKITVRATPENQDGILVSISGVKFNKVFPIIKDISLEKKKPTAIENLEIEFAFNDRMVIMATFDCEMTRTFQVEREVFNNAKRYTQPNMYKAPNKITKSKVLRWKLESKIRQCRRIMKKFLKFPGFRF